MKPNIYLDHAATTYVDPAVLEAMMPYFSEDFGNASSLHSFGRKTAQAVTKARDTIARIINAKPSEIYFTSGGTESDNWAIKGIASAHRGRGNHIITSKIEHHAVLHTLKQLETQGFTVTYVDVDKDGKVDLDQLESAITDQTILITVMTANNEVGTIQPIEEIGKIARRHNVPFHTDAVQAMGAVKIDVEKMNVDMLSMSGHKFYGPKGIGVLYIRNKLKVDKFIIGGAQERTMRGGTTNTPQIVGLAKALELAYENLEENNAKLIAMRDSLIEQIEATIPFCRLNGHRTDRLPNNVNFSFEFVEGESILMMCDLAGIAVSTGSACSSASLESSHVLVAMGVPIEIAHGSVRFTFGKRNTMEDVSYVAEKLKEILERLRAMSPLFNVIGGENQNV